MNKLLTGLLTFLVPFASALTFAPKPGQELPALELPQVSPLPSWRHNAYLEDRPLPVFTEFERRSSMLFFQRPITAPIFPQSRPAPWERIEELSTFAARGQLATLTFSVFPLKGLKGLSARASAPFSGGELRQVAYVNFRYPHYTTKGTYRRAPGYSHPVGASDCPALEPRRYILTVPIPSHAAPGLYRGEILVWHREFGQAVSLPYAIRVLPFDLVHDPRKHISAYAVGIRSLNQGKAHAKDSQWLHDASVQEFRQMRNYGFTGPGTMFLNYTQEDGGRLYLSHIKELKREWEEAGLRPTRLFVLGACVSELYRKFVGKSFDRTRMVMPPEAFFVEFERLCGNFQKSYRSLGLPEMYLIAFDEPSPHHLPYYKRLFAILKKTGFKTFGTTCPFKKEVADVVDVWNDQHFTPEAEMKASGRTEFWCYPNHSVYEQRETAIMTRGGRMTYGFGFWRSQYTALLPWMWTWYQRKQPQGIEFGGQILQPDGSMLMEWEWESIREGCIDGDYIYTLQNAIVQRDTPQASPALKQLIAQGRELLQQLWNEIPVVPKYLDNNHWRDIDFQQKRLLLADMIHRLMAYPAANAKQAPSVLAKTGKLYRDLAGADFFQKQSQAGNLQFVDVPTDVWHTNGEKEGSIRFLPDGVVEFTMKVDHKLIGNNNGYYRGTPSLDARFKKAIQLDEYGFLTYELKWSSNRHLTRNSTWPHELLFFFDTPGKSSDLRRIRPDFNHEPDIWHRQFYSLDSVKIPQKSNALKRFWFYLREIYYEHGDVIVLQVRNFKLVGAKRPLARDIACPSVSTDETSIRWQIRLFGLKSGQTVTARFSLTDGQNKVVARKAVVLADAVTEGDMASLSSVHSGEYQLQVELMDGQQPYQRLSTGMRIVDLKD